MYIIQRKKYENTTIDHVVKYDIFDFIKGGNKNFLFKGK